MKLLPHSRHHLQRCIGALILLGLAGSATAQVDRLEMLMRQLEADVREVARARQARWVELPTGGSSMRHFVQELHRRKEDNTVLAQLRVDYMSAASDGAASEVQTVWLYCNEGTKRVVVTREFNVQGRQTSLRETPDAAAERIENLYAGPEQLVCSEQYLLLEVADGYRRLGEALALRKQMRAARVPDRPVPAD